MRITKQQMPLGEKPKKQLNKGLLFSGIAFQMLVIIGIGTFAGVKLDEKFPNEYNLFTLICSLASIGISLYFVIKKVTKLQFQKKK